MINPLIVNLLMENILNISPEKYTRIVSIFNTETKKYTLLLELLAVIWVPFLSRHPIFSYYASVYR